MAKLNQIIAIEKGTKTEAYRKFTDIDKLLRKPEPLSGIRRSYTPKDEEGEQLPPEIKLVQVRAWEEIRNVVEALTDLYNVTAKKDWANQDAKARVVIGEGEDAVELFDGQEIPVTYLMFLEKQLDDIATFVGRLPVLPPSEEWNWDSNTGSYATKQIETTRTKKVPRSHVKYEATKEHPAQVEMYHEDIIVGHWSQVRFSGALPRETIDEILGKVKVLRRAVKFAREEANKIQVRDKMEVGSAFFDFIFGGLEQEKTQT